MSTILITYERTNATTEINIESYKELLSALNNEVRVKKTQSVTAEDLGWCDICLAIRPNSIYSVAIAKAAVSAGRYYISSFDDDIVNLPKPNPEAWKRKYAIMCIKKSNAVFSTSPFILKDYRKYSNDYNSVWTDAFVRSSDIKKTHNVGEKIRIIYPAGADHIDLYNKYIKPIVNELFDMYPDKLDFTFVGVKPNVNEFKYPQSVHLVDAMPFGDYQKYMMINDFDIGIAPLCKTNFNERKYFIKFIEYAKYSIAGLYSDVFPYKTVVFDKHNGVLVNNSANNWKQALIMLIEDGAILRNIVDNSQKYLQQNLLFEIVCKKLKEQCQELGSFKSPKPNNHINIVLSKFYVIIYILHDILARTIYHLRKDGIKYIFQYIKKR